MLPYQPAPHLAYQAAPQQQQEPAQGFGGAAGPFGYAGAGAMPLLDEAALLQHS